MKILLYSHVFHPSTGGVETVSRTLAEGLVQRGDVSVRLVTHTAEDDGTPFPFPVLRRPGPAELREALRWADVVLFNGASLALQPALLLSRKPFIWVHVGYQVSCIDGLGWVDGEPAPLTPAGSFGFHRARSGLGSALRGWLKLMLRRLVAHRLVWRNVAITQWMLETQPLPRQLRIYNPFPIGRFAQARAADAADFDFVYLGRLVSEKGVDTLLHALAQASARCVVPPRLLLIGDGERAPALQALARELNVHAQVHFAGRQSGAELVDWVGRGAVGVVPSAWLEPMGGVAIELMAAGRPLIVSQRGGLAECAGDAGLIFPNGDANALAECMLRLQQDPALRRTLGARARERAREFVPERFVDDYVRLLSAAVERR